MAKMDLATAIASADAIVIGTVDKQLRVTQGGSALSAELRQRMRDHGLSDQAIDQQVSDFSTWIYTTWQFRVERSLKGEFTGGTIEIRRPGGELNGQKLEVPAAPQLLTGDRQLIFLVRAWDGPYQAVAVYRITGNMVSTTDQGRKDNMSLDALIAEIEAHKKDANPFQTPPTSSGGSGSTTPTESAPTSPTP